MSSLGSAHCYCYFSRVGVIAFLFVAPPLSLSFLILLPFPLPLYTTIAGALACALPRSCCMNIDGVALASLCLGVCGCVRLRAVACGCVWLRVVACGCVWLRAVGVPLFQLLSFDSRGNIIRGVAVPQDGAHGYVLDHTASPPLAGKTQHGPRGGGRPGQMVPDRYLLDGHLPGCFPPSY